MQFFVKDVDADYKSDDAVVTIESSDGRTFKVIFLDSNLNDVPKIKTVSTYSIEEQSKILRMAWLRLSQE